MYYRDGGGLTYSERIGREAFRCDWCPELVIRDNGRTRRALDGVIHEDTWDITYRTLLARSWGCRECGETGAGRHSCPGYSAPNTGGPPIERVVAPVESSPSGTAAPVLARLEVNTEDLIP
jgi:hypothetical protein